MIGLLTSLCDTQSDCAVTVLDCGLASDERGRLAARFSALKPRFEDVGRHLDELPHPECGSPATYARLLTPRVFDEGRVLYLDADTVVRDDLRPVFEIDLEGRAIGAVTEFYTPTAASDRGIADWHKLGIAPATPYFNAGVMLIDIDRWRAEDISEKAFAYLRRTDISIDLFDQEALNVAVSGRWKSLPLRWNTTSYWWEKGVERPGTRHALGEAAILHFLSPAKPWLPGAATPGWAVDLYRDFAERWSRIRECDDGGRVSP